MIVRTFDGVQALTTPAGPTWIGQSNSLTLYGLNQAYADIYAAQPNVRIPIDFLAENIAELSPPHVYRRVGDTDRVRLVDHQIARWLARPNPWTSSFRLFEGLVGDMGVYYNAYWLKVRYTEEATGEPALGFVRLPPEEMTIEGGIVPSHFVWTANGRKKDLPLSEVVYFGGYNPRNALMGLSRLETLRRIIGEEHAAGEHRENYWRNAARIDGIVTRPKEKPRYTLAQVQSWREQWQSIYAGGANAGKALLLQDGEEFTAASFSAKDSEYIQGGKLRREIHAAQYNIPQPMIGILDHATFSNIREQHKHLYQDTLGPWFRRLKLELERQVLTECKDQRDVYLEWNIDAKLAGTPEERAASLSLAVGRPWMSVNEARAFENLPRKVDPSCDEIAPQQGGPAQTSSSSSRPASAFTRTDGAEEEGD